MRLRLHQRWAITILAAAFCTQLSGCGYPQVSPKAYEISKALYSVCNQKSTERLPAISELIEDALADGSLQETEGVWLNDIVTAGQNGDWESAARESRRIMDDQVGR
ncbi:hypothetical protein CA54_56480 [Symmachiella macrocystis]|uniref:Uncharacterized protein n=1 Tax=Symmachiella macrocystis TaxID=2527985 RepID=A0A5C6B501_9PLAN|nr:hypothetical protein [Symmachiella macrocystis]TWU07243.1 hypothetical protein CA54_56480 [Symmachiella macrocystis]